MKALAEPGPSCHVTDYVAPLSVGWHELCKRHPAVLGEVLSGGHPVVPVAAPMLDRGQTEPRQKRSPCARSRDNGRNGSLRALLPLPMWICRAACSVGIIMGEEPAMAADEVPSAGQFPAVSLPSQPFVMPEAATQSATGNTGAETQNTTNAAQQAEPQTPPAMEQPTVAENKPTEVKSTTEGTVSVEPGKPQEVVKPQETVKKSEPVKAEKAKTEKTSKAENAAKAQQGKKQQSKEQQAKTEKQVVDILEGRSSGSKPAPAGSKTLTVPQGVTLMQVFRDNKLPIADVNAMTKAHGAGNALSRFKPGDKVQVSLNSQGRVSEMRLSNGSRFVRQSDGSYQFKK